jgi:hypothetical protein
MSSHILVWRGRHPDVARSIRIGSDAGFFGVPLGLIHAASADSDEAEDRAT